MRELSAQQAEFVTHYTSGEGSIGNAAEAARRAGYSVASARDIGSQLMGKPHVKAAVDQAIRNRFSGSMAAEAAEVVRSIMLDASAPAKARLDAANSILNRAGITARPWEAAGAGGPQRGAGQAALEATPYDPREAEDAAQEAAQELSDMVARFKAQHASGELAVAEGA